MKSASERTWKTASRLWLALPKTVGGVCVCHIPGCGGEMAALSRIHDWQGQGISEKLALAWIARARALILKHNLMTFEKLEQVSADDAGRKQMELF